jgi:hypothetical protein
VVPLEDGAHPAAAELAHDGILVADPVGEHSTNYRGGGPRLNDACGRRALPPTGRIAARAGPAFLAARDGDGPCTSLCVMGRMGPPNLELPPQGQTVRVSNERYAA